MLVDAAAHGGEYCEARLRPVIKDIDASLFELHRKASRAEVLSVLLEENLEGHGLDADRLEYLAEALKLEIGSVCASALDLREVLEGWR